MVESRTEVGDRTPVIGNPGGSIADVLQPASGARALADAAARKAGQWTDDLARHARDMPLPALGMALALGVVIGLIVGAAAGRSRD